MIPTVYFCSSCKPQVTHWFDFWVLLVQNCCCYVPLKICMNLSRLLTAPLKPTSKSYLWHLSIIGLLPIYLMAKSHQSSTPPIPPPSSQFKHLTASGKMRFNLFSLRTSLKCSVNTQYEKYPKDTYHFGKKNKKNRVLRGKHSEPPVNQYVWNSPKMWCYFFFFGLLFPSSLLLEISR